MEGGANVPQVYIRVRGQFVGICLSIHHVNWELNKYLYLLSYLVGPNYVLIDFFASLYVICCFAAQHLDIFDCLMICKIVIIIANI